MKEIYNHKLKIMKKIFIVWALLTALGACGYVKGIIKFAGCDFEKPFKVEIVHGLGIVCGTGVITGWMNFGNNLTNLKT